MSGIYHENKLWANVSGPNVAGATPSENLITLTIDGVTYDTTELVFCFDDNGSLYTDSTKATAVSGDESKLYIATNTGKQYQYNGSAFSALGVNAIGDLSDVTITSASDGQALEYDGTAGKWKNVAKKAADTPTFSEASTRANISGSGETMATILGKIKKWFSDLKDLAFKAIDGANSKKYLRGDGTWQSALELQGRVYGSGDDEGLVIKANTENHWAGLSLVSNTGRHSYIAMKDNDTNAPFWRYNNGTVQYDAYHPAKTGTLAVTGDIPDAVAVKGDKESTYRTGNVNLTPANIGAVYYAGNLNTTLPSGTPAAETIAYWENNDNVPVGSVVLGYNSAGEEFTIIFSKGANNQYGSIIKYGYGSKYIRILRKQANQWKSNDWEVMDAGYADTAGSAPASDVYAWAKEANKPTYTASEVGATQGYLCTIPNQSSPSAGWRRLCKMPYVANHGYSSGIIHIGGGYANGAPTGAVVAFSIMHFTPSFTVLNCAYKGLVKWLRFVRGTGDDDLWLDAYMSAQSGAVSPQVFFISGNVNVTDIQNSATIITDEVTPLAQIEINTVIGKVITSDDIGSQSVNYAATAGSATDSTKLPLSGGTMTGAISGCENDVLLKFRNNATYYTTASYQTAGNEALVFATKMGVTSFMFINGEDSVANHSNSRWQSLTPALQIKNNKVAIGKLIAQGTDLTYPLEVNGDVQATNFRGNLVGTADKATKDGDGNTISSTYLKMSDVLHAEGTATAATTGRRNLTSNIKLSKGTYFIQAWAAFDGGTGKKGLRIIRGDQSYDYFAESYSGESVETGYPKTLSCFYVMTVTTTSFYVKAEVYTSNNSASSIEGGIIAFKIA